ncbi:GMC oxidoreductase [Actinoplanes solisilvae]|uniref:GMC oxidoreductase n=1 Tax=Actinoplanes solisilvae TaxID=2486853 RepID=UPI000FDA4E29
MACTPRSGTSDAEATRAVVDPDRAVHGLVGPRVVDASVIPTVLWATTQPASALNAPSTSSSGWWLEIVRVREKPVGPTGLNGRPHSCTDLSRTRMPFERRCRQLAKICGCGERTTARFKTPRTLPSCAVVHAEPRRS